MNDILTCCLLLLLNLLNERGRLDDGKQWHLLVIARRHCGQRRDILHLLELGHAGLLGRNSRHLRLQLLRLGSLLLLHELSRVACLLWSKLLELLWLLSASLRQVARLLVLHWLMLHRLLLLLLRNEACLLGL